MKKINLSITGCLGRMGQQLIKSSKETKNFKIVSITENKKITSEYLKELLINRKNKKNITYSLSEVELELCDFPNIECFKHVFGSYSKICNSIGLKNILNRNLPTNFFKNNDTFGCANNQT